MTKKPLDRYNSADIAQMVREDTQHYDCDPYPKQDFENGTLSRITGEDIGAVRAAGLVVIWLAICALVVVFGIGWHLAGLVFG